ncbi:sulfatase [Lentisphaera profundi]|uniref:Sulfatase n=1 Tax=Lentisphaera profundi TaxID=1658616 RepID=A0ABY7VXP1_9BACT|nr:sulfatase [Lentisphaera profundi]WDE98482.1 sulfatase [Lentisphaera profundi]
MKYFLYLLFLSTFFLQAEIAAKPNILFIIVDDLRPELGCYGNTLIKTPHIDKLATQSTVFDRAYCQQAVCGASRASFLSGLRPDSTRIYDIHTQLTSTQKDCLTLPLFFKSKAYETISMGKVYHHLSDDPNAWSRAPKMLTGSWHGKQGYVGDAYKQYSSTDWIPAGAEKRAAWECEDVPDNRYPDGALAEQAITQLERLKKDSQPFFMALGFSKPHLPFNAPKKYWDLYNPAELYKSTMTDWPKKMPRIAPRYSEELRNYSGIIQKREQIKGEIGLKLVHGYYACTSYVDAQIGLVLNSLDRLKLRDNTIVVLIGDHGFKLGDYGSWCKHTNFEIDTRVPMLISSPCSPASQTQSLSELVDIYPTLVDLCGFSIPEHCEGLSLKSILEKPSAELKNAAFSQYPRSQGKVMGYSIRSGKWRYTEWTEIATGKIKNRELYKHETSSIATHNEVFNPENKTLIKKLSQQLASGQGWKSKRRQ